MALRLSEIDLNAGKTSLVNNKAIAEINGGKQQDLTVALNWYLNPYVRTCINYVNVLDLSGGSYADKNLSLVQWRGQIAF